MTQWLQCKCTIGWLYCYVALIYVTFVYLLLNPTYLVWYSFTWTCCCVVRCWPGGVCCETLKHLPTVACTADNLMYHRRPGTDRDVTCLHDCLTLVVSHVCMCVGFESGWPVCIIRLNLMYMLYNTQFHSLLKIVIMSCQCARLTSQVNTRDVNVCWQKSKHFISSLRITKEPN